MSIPFLVAEGKVFLYEYHNGRALPIQVLIMILDNKTNYDSE
jgi:hypothetical protein